MKIDELYAKYDHILGPDGLKVNQTDHFIFDLTDDNSQKSLKLAFPGIETVIMPESGKYLVVSPIVESPDILVMMFPQQSDGSLGLWAFNTKIKKGCNLINDGAEGQKPTLDNFNDFANMEEIARRFNEFTFMSANGEDPTTEVKDIGSFDVSNDEPVEIPNNADNEETKMTTNFKPIQNESELDSELKDTKWVEIPNTTAHGVTVTEDEGAGGEDPFADGSLDATAPEGGDATAPADGAGDAAPAEGDVTADAGADAPPAEGDAAAEPPAEEAPAEDAPADTGTETIDDPKAKMRDLLAYYTNYMNELVQDPNTSTELISATQEMIDSLIKNMESADGIEEVKAETEEAAKEDVAVADAPAEETPAEGDAAPAEGDAATGGEEAPVAEGTGCAVLGGAAGAAVGGPVGAAIGAGVGSVMEETEDQEKIDDKIDSEVDDLHKDDIEPIEPIGGEDILPPGDLTNSAVNDVGLEDVPPTADDELAATTPDMAAPAPTSDVLDDTALPTPDETVDLLGTDDIDDYGVGADGLPLGTYDGGIDAMTTSPVAKKINWSSDYATSGLATSDDNNVVVPEVLTELGDYYKKVADEVSKIPGKEDVAMKLQKIQILTQTIANEWNGITSQIGDTVANSYDLSNMGDLEKDELASQDAMNMVGADVLAGQEAEEEDDLKINNDIAAFVESFKHLY